ncbi:MAG: hypothetical protein JW846_02110 [Dehalococcoidia bacterium]|nr:hypothetical protein [Dehalococcoidia bacterium]
MRWFTVACLVGLLLAQSVPASSVVMADGDPLEGLNDEERAYVSRMRTAYATARAAVAELDGVVNGAVAGAIFGAETSATEIVGAMLSCSGKLKASAQILREGPPASMQGLAESNAAVAATLESSYESCAYMMAGEGANRVLAWGRDFFGNLFNAPPAAEESGLSAKARIVSCLSDDSARVKDVLDAGEAALNAQIQEVQLQQEMGEDFLEAFISGECFIATAAYGTKSAEEIQILRDFRDDVLMLSPAGRDFVHAYYRFSPPVADFISQHEMLRTAVREGLVDPIVGVVGMTKPLFSLW